MAVDFPGGGVDDGVLPSGAHTRILPLAVMIARAANGEPAFDLIEPGGAGRGEVEMNIEMNIVVVGAPAIALGRMGVAVVG